MEEKINTSKHQPDDISLDDFLSSIRDWYTRISVYKITILLFVLLGGMAGGLYSWFKKTSYVATTTFVLEESDKGGGLAQYAGIASMVGVDLGGSGGGIFHGDNIIELYKSGSMITKTLFTPVDDGQKKILLINKYIEFKKLRKKWQDDPQLVNINFVAADPDKEIKFSRLQDSVIKTIVKDISKYSLRVTKPDKKLSIILAEVSSENEFFAKNFNDEIVKNVNDFYVSTKTKKSLDMVMILQKKTDSVRSVLNGAINKAASIQDATPNLNITRQIQRTAPVQRSQFSAEANKQILGQLVQNLELTKMSLNKETPLIQVVDKPIYPLDKDEAGKLKWILIGSIAAFFLTVLVLSLKILINKTLTFDK